MEGLTARQQQVLDFIGSYLGKHDYPPTVREIAAEIGTSGTVSAIHHLDALQRKGYLQREPHSSRGIRLTKKAEEELTQIPILGRVQAGLPTLAYEDVEGYYQMEEATLRGGAFFVRVRGESMVGDGILDGDLVLVRPQPTAENGDIVVALVNTEATIKRFYRVGNQVRLEPSNPEMKPILVGPNDEILIAGKVVKVVRDLS